MAVPRASGRLDANLAALSRVDPGLVRRLALPCERGHVQLDPPAYRLHRALVPLAVDARLAARAVAAAGDAERLLVLGVGLGEVLAAALGSGARDVLAWDRDPWLLTLALERYDVAHELATGRLRLALGADLAALEDDARGRARVAHPLLGSVYGLEARRLDRPRGRCAGLVTGGLFVDDVAAALDAHGFSVQPLEAERWAVEELDHAVAAARPELVVAINVTHGLAEFCQRHGLPLVVWEIDPSTDRLPPLAAPCPSAHAFTYRRAHVATFRAAGYAHAEHLPLAADPERRRPLRPSDDDRVRYGAPVAFVGSSLASSAADLRGRFVELATRALGASARRRVEAAAGAVLAAQREDLGAYRVPELLAEHLPELAGAPLDEDPAQLLAETSASEKRLTWIGALGPLGVHVWGDDGWRAIEDGGARYRGSAGHGRELTAIYSTARVHVDVGRLYQGDIATMRVFDVLACGGFLIAEASEDVEALFDVGRELETYRTPAELAAKVARYLARPDEARAIAERGLAAVRERHTVRARLAHMLDRAGVAV